MYYNNSKVQYKRVQINSTPPKIDTVNRRTSTGKKFATEPFSGSYSSKNTDYIYRRKKESLPDAAFDMTNNGSDIIYSMLIYIKMCFLLHYTNNIILNVRLKRAQSRNKQKLYTRISCQYIAT